MFYSATAPIRQHIKQYSVLLPPLNFNRILNFIQTQSTQIDQSYTILYDDNQRPIRRYFMKNIAFEKQLELFEWRHTTSKSISKILHINAQYWVKNNIKQKIYYVYTEHLQKSLQDVRQLPLAEILYLFRELLSASEQILQVIGELTIKKQNCGIDCHGKLKFWINQNIQFNKNQVICYKNQKSIIKSIVNILESIQSKPCKLFFESLENFFVKQNLYTIRKTLDFITYYAMRSKIIISQCITQKEFTRNNSRPTTSHIPEFILINNKRKKSIPLSIKLTDRSQKSLNKSTRMFYQTPDKQNTNNCAKFSHNHKVQSQKKSNLSNKVCYNFGTEDKNKTNQIKYKYQNDIVVNSLRKIGSAEPNKLHKNPAKQKFSNLRIKKDKNQMRQSQIQIPSMVTNKHDHLDSYFLKSVDTKKLNSNQKFQDVKFSQQKFRHKRINTAQVPQFLLDKQKLNGSNINNNCFLSARKSRQDDNHYKDEDEVTIKQFNDFQYKKPTRNITISKQFSLTIDEKSSFIVKDNCGNECKKVSMTSTTNGSYHPSCEDKLFGVKMTQSYTLTEFTSEKNILSEKCGNLRQKLIKNLISNKSNDRKLIQKQNFKTIALLQQSHSIREVIQEQTHNKSSPLIKQQRENQNIFQSFDHDINLNKSQCINKWNKCIKILFTQQEEDLKQSICEESQQCKTTRNNYDQIKLDKLGQFGRAVASSFVKQ